MNCVQLGASVEADVLEEVVLVVMADRLPEWKYLLLGIAAAELNFSHHVELRGGEREEERSRGSDSYYTVKPLIKDTKTERGQTSQQRTGSSMHKKVTSERATKDKMAGPEGVLIMR